MLVNEYVPPAAVVALETPQPLQLTVTPWSGLLFESGHRPVEAPVLRQGDVLVRGAARR